MTNILSNTVQHLNRASIHEISGAGATSFVLWFSSQSSTLLCGPPQILTNLHPEGLPTNAITPTHIQCPNREDALWAAETSLRSGAFKTVICFLYKTPDLTPMRRLQLAAQAGNSTGLIVTEQAARSSAAETRWTCSPVFDAENDSTLLKAEMYKNKKGTIGGWIIDLNNDPPGFGGARGDDVASKKDGTSANNIGKRTGQFTCITSTSSKNPPKTGPQKPSAGPAATADQPARPDRLAD